MSDDWKKIDEAYRRGANTEKEMRKMWWDGFMWCGIALLTLWGISYLLTEGLNYLKIYF